MKSLLIYNLYPGLYKNILEWEKNLEKILNMGFNSLFINSLHYPGLSGSIYAVKDYYKLNDRFFISGSSSEDQLKNFLKLCKEKKIEIFMDLIVNHSSIDCILLDQHKNWYKTNEKGDLENPGTWENGKWITWGDLASFNLEYSPDNENLWNYFIEVCRFYLNLGFTGFRCDAAYQVPSDFWSFLISKVKKEFPDSFFIGETLGCTPVQIQALSTCGFDYIFNSSKWWNFNDSWCLEQYELTRNISPSISFPESHDTPRLMEEVSGISVKVLQRLYFEAIFSKGFMITTGFEYGFKKKINTVTTSQNDWEKTGIDLTGNIKRILSIKKALSPLSQESQIIIIDQENWRNVFCFVKVFENTKILLCLNKDSNTAQQLKLSNIEEIIGAKKIKDYSPDNRLEGNIKNLETVLNPGELKIFACEKSYIK
jgi:hypothetical protein